MKIKIDWFYDYADDPREYQRGHKQVTAFVLRIAKKYPTTICDLLIERVCPKEVWLHLKTRVRLEKGEDRNF